MADVLIRFLTKDSYLKWTGSQKVNYKEQPAIVRFYRKRDDHLFYAEQTFRKAEEKLIHLLLTSRSAFEYDQASACIGEGLDRTTIGKAYVRIREKLNVFLDGKVNQYFELKNTQPKMMRFIRPEGLEKLEFTDEVSVMQVEKILSMGDEALLSSLFQGDSPDHLSFRCLLDSARRDGQNGDLRAARKRLEEAAESLGRVAGLKNRREDLEQLELLKAELHSKEQELSANYSTLEQMLKTPDKKGKTSEAASLEELMEAQEKLEEMYRKTGRYYLVTEGISAIAQRYIQEIPRQPYNLELLEAAYRLTDILDRTYLYALNEELCAMIQKILRFYYNSEERCELQPLRFQIGILYTQAISKLPEKEEKARIVSGCLSRMDQLERFVFGPESRKIALQALPELRAFFLSDYAAILINKANLSEDREERLRILEEALSKHEEAEQYRREELEELHDSRAETIEEAKERVNRSVNARASCLFHLGRYRESIEAHKESLAYRVASNQVSNSYLTRRYMIGSYMKLIQTDELTEEEKNTCRELIRTCLQYYTIADTRVLAGLEENLQMLEA